MSSQPQVQDNPEQNRYEIRVDDGLAGFVDYQRGKRSIAFTHTEIDPAYGGQGLGSTLVRAVLDDAREAGLNVKPFCPFVRKFIAKHADYLDLVAEADRAEFGL